MEHCVTECEYPTVRCPQVIAGARPDEAQDCLLPIIPEWADRAYVQPFVTWLAGGGWMSVRTPKLKKRAVMVSVVVPPGTAPVPVVAPG